MTFQDLILSLQGYWAKQGCVIQQPYDTEKGAGTFNPATFLRVLGPEPWNVAYVEPSRRPTDGRYGDNPNRLQHYYQFQVIMKPNPMNILDLYLDSLRAFGLTGERTIILHGYTPSPQNLQRLSKALTFNSKIEASFYHAVEVHELMGIY